VEIERKKRLYASQNIDELLVEAHINYGKYTVGTDHESGLPSYLPLEVFDDTEFECTNPEDWIKAGTTSEGTCNIPAKALFFDKDDRGSFKSCMVNSWDAKEMKFGITWTKAEGGPQTDKNFGAADKTFRVHLYFCAEDPFTFVRRVVEAHRARRSFEATIRYSLYVDSMPSDELSPLDTEQVNRILLLALNTKKLKQNALDTTSLLNEINIDYQRTMNKIIFDVNLKDPNQQALKELLRLPDEPEEAPKKAPQSGVVSVPFHDLPIHFSDFCFHSFNTKLEAITALTSVNDQMLQLTTMNLFNTSIVKSVRLDEFEQMQNANMVQINKFLKDQWCSN
jgi:dynein heavy chain